MGVGQGAAPGDRTVSPTPWPLRAGGIVPTGRNRPVSPRAAGYRRPHRRADLARSRVRGVSQVILLHKPLPQGQNHRYDRRGTAGPGSARTTSANRASASWGHSRCRSTSSSSPLMRSYTTANATALSCGGVRGAAARNGRDEAKVSERNGQSQLRFRAGNSASVLTRGLDVQKVCLCPLLHREACEAN